MHTKRQNKDAFDTIEHALCRLDNNQLKWYFDKVIFGQISSCKLSFVIVNFKGTVTQIEKTLINERLSILKVFWKFRVPTIYNFAVIYP